jgi:hypothetical protein
MSNYRRSGPSAEQRPRDDGWGPRRDQHREPPPSRNNSTWNPPSGETSRDARRNDFGQPGPRNRSEYSSSGQYIPMSRRNQLESDRRPEGRSDIDPRSSSTFPAAGRRPPTAPRDQYAAPRNERAEVDESRRRDFRKGDEVRSTAGFQRSR